VNQKLRRDVVTQSEGFEVRAVLIKLAKSRGNIATWTRLIGCSTPTRQ
jgi:hypothetical protein